MWGKLIVCVVFISLNFTGFSQSSKDSVENQKSVVRLHLITLGIGFENKIDNNKTLLIDFGAGFSLLMTEMNGKRNTDIKLIPYLLVEPRIYTNLKERKDKGKRTDCFSGAYGAFKLQVGENLSDEQWYVQMGPLVGFQRALGKSGYWSIGIGVGSTIFQEEVNFGLIGDLKLGFILK